MLPTAFGAELFEVIGNIQTVLSKINFCYGFSTSAVQIFYPVEFKNAGKCLGWPSSAWHCMALHHSHGKLLNLSSFSDHSEDISYFVKAVSIYSVPHTTYAEHDFGVTRGWDAQALAAFRR